MIYGDNTENTVPDVAAILQSGNLYVYCIGNPVNYRDTKGSNIIPFAVGDYLYSFAQREYNFWVHNQKYSFTGYINNQKIGNASQIKFGAFYSSFNGCGWIAVYNTLLNLGGFSHPANIVHELEGGALLHGALGVSPITVRDYFRNRGYRAVLCLDNFDSNAKSGDASILMYLHPDGAHYIALKWTGSEYRTYNVYDEGYSVVTFDSIEGFLEKEGYTGLAIIVVNYS